MNRVHAMCVFALAGTFACKDQTRQSEASSGGVGNPQESSVSPPPDQLASGELLEGKQSASGLVLPEGMKIVRETPNLIRVRGAVDLESFSTYVRKRVDAEVETGPNHTLFSRAVVKAPVGGAHFALRVEITAEGRHTIAEISVDARGFPGGARPALSSIPDDDP